MIGIDGHVSFLPPKKKKKKKNPRGVAQSLLVVAMAVGVVVVAGEAGRVITIALRVAAGRALMPMCTPSLLCIPLPR